MSKSESERLNVKNNTTSAILRCSALHDQSASLGRHAQLTRCFSAIAELLVQYSDTDRFYSWNSEDSVIDRATLQTVTTHKRQV